MIIIGTASLAKSWPPPAELVWARPEVPDLAEAQPRGVYLADLVDLPELYRQHFQPIVLLKSQVDLEFPWGTRAHDDALDQRLEDVPSADRHSLALSRSSDCSASARVGRHSTLAAYLLGSEQWGGLPPLVIGLPGANLVGRSCQVGVDNDRSWTARQVKPAGSDTRPPPQRGPGWGWGDGVSGAPDPPPQGWSEAADPGTGVGALGRVSLARARARNLVGDTFLGSNRSYVFGEGYRQPVPELGLPPPSCPPKVASPGVPAGHGGAVAAAVGARAGGAVAQARGRSECGGCGGAIGAAGERAQALRLLGGWWHRRCWLELAPARDQALRSERDHVQRHRALAEYLLTAEQVGGLPPLLVNLYGPKLVGYSFRDGVDNDRYRQHRPDRA